MTRIDALILLRTSRGEELLAIEIKYSDRFNSRRVNIDRPAYRALARSVDLWLDVESTLQTAEINQLARCHALVSAVSRDILTGSFLPSVLVLHHEDDPAARAITDTYSSHLHNPALTCAVTLGDFVSAIRHHAQSSGQREVARALELRYVLENESEPAWKKFTAVRSG